MNSGNNSTGGVSSKSSASRGNGGKNKQKRSTKPKAYKEPQRGMGVAKLEELRSSALNNTRQQDFDVIGQAAGYYSVHPLSQAPPPVNNPFRLSYHQQPNAMLNFGGLMGVTLTADDHAVAVSVNPQPYNWERKYAADNNNAQQPHFAKPVLGSSRPVFLFPARARDAENIEMDFLGKRQKREEGGPNGDEEIDLELKL